MVGGLAGWGLLGWCWLARMVRCRTGVVTSLAVTGFGCCPLRRHRRTRDVRGGSARPSCGQGCIARGRWLSLTDGKAAGGAAVAARRIPAGPERRR